MPEQPGTVTDRLSDVIHIVVMARQTGILTAERGSGARLEEGCITFLNGQIVQVQAGERRDAEALQRLRTWGLCRFTFTIKTPAEITATPLHPSPGSLPTTDSLAKEQPITQDLKMPETSEIAERSAPKMPYRLREPATVLPFMEQANIPRLHRRVYLLVDGKRSPQELAQLIGRTTEEIQKVLGDLERAGVVKA